MQSDKSPREPLPARLGRFSDWASFQEMCQIGGGGSRVFYSGQDVSARMDNVREAIKYIRTNWNNYPAFMEDLRHYMDEDTVSSMVEPTEEDLRKVAVVLSSAKEWADRQHDTLTVDDFSTLRLYTSDYGYVKIFKLINDGFRMDSLTDQELRLRSAVFLVELLNIDLFNYRSRFPGNFQGTVYRGLGLSAVHLQEFKNLAVKESIRDRYWAIPLAMMSCSKNVNTALAFATTERAKQAENYQCLWRIHVAELDPKLLNIYNQRFPSSVVSTICAVPVAELSEFQEDEVLLRGPFFQLIRIQEEVLEGSETALHVMDAVMLNTNRDHPSTMDLEESEGRKARELFACLVGMSRAEVCEKLAEQYNMPEDTLAYAKLYREQRDKFLSLERSLG